MSFDKQCKNDIDMRKIFWLPKYYYYLTPQCSFNMNYYLGTYKETLTYYEFVAYAFQLMVAVQTLHRLGIWHTDIKPANILLCNNMGRVQYNYQDISWSLETKKTLKLIDFDISKVVDDISFPCQYFTNEMNAVGLVFMIMWAKVVGDKDETLYQDLITRTRMCQTSTLDIMLTAPIFSPLLGKGGYEVNLLV